MRTRATRALLKISKRRGERQRPETDEEFRLGVDSTNGAFIAWAMALVACEQTVFVKRARIQKEFNALPSCHFAFGMLGGNFLGSAHRRRFCSASF